MDVQALQPGLVQLVQSPEPGVVQSRCPRADRKQRAAQIQIGEVPPIVEGAATTAAPTAREQHCRQRTRRAKRLHRVERALVQKATATSCWEERTRRTVAEKAHGARGSRSPVSNASPHFAASEKQKKKAARQAADSMQARVAGILAPFTRTGADLFCSCLFCAA